MTVNHNIICKKIIKEAFSMGYECAIKQDTKDTVYLRLKSRKEPLACISMHDFEGETYLDLGALSGFEEMFLYSNDILRHAIEQARFNILEKSEEDIISGSWTGADRKYHKWSDEYVKRFFKKYNVKRVYNNE